ncbi:O-methyltransferase [Cyclobacterium qasimii]|uniref:O-methyltransferase-like protein n=2 Tax=Cyclobacterium qasimii TaxID=1350429 RepID=S7VD57_9BACT|nr:class I SAM-dependent methyltransferase [Cyclobacterium qasimii]EPR67921.1 hypothetical protein ADICYQ_2993 [Cyclobacterium qasimii M12-11B]GEO23058.1 hypothetical protein CQA01_35920 [Cyclobacterium qasimii]
MIKKVFDKIGTLIKTRKRKLETKSVLMELGADEDKVINNLVGTFKFMMSHKQWSEEEIKSLSLVNEIREGHRASNETVDLMDYGAGNSKLQKKRTEKQMREGVIEQFKIADVCRKRSIQKEWGELIFKIIRDFKPTNCLELGTCLGVSAAYQVSALKLNGKGKFTTIEGSDVLARHADNNLKKLNYPDYSVHMGRFSDVLPKILSKDQPIDFAFIDGHHDKEATKGYFELIYPFLSDRAILIFDDINWSQGMKEVWEHLYKNGEGVKISFDFIKWGICVIDKNGEKKENYYYPISL